MLESPEHRALGVREKKKMETKKQGWDFRGFRDKFEET